MRRQGSRTKDTAVCENVEQEFCTRALLLLASFYETPTVDPIATMPPVKPGDSLPSPPVVAFNSAIADLRLRRAQEQQLAAHKAMCEQIATRAEEMSQLLRKTDANLDDVFLSESAPRPNKPLYQANLERDANAAAAFALEQRKPRYKPLEIGKVEREFKRRLDECAARGADRARRRIERTEVSGKGPYKVESPHWSLGQRLEEERQALQGRRAAQLNYKTPNEYRSLLKPKATQPTATEPTTVDGNE
jgi:hypothetical protein